MAGHKDNVKNGGKNGGENGDAALWAQAVADVTPLDAGTVKNSPNAAVLPARPRLPAVSRREPAPVPVHLAAQGRDLDHRTEKRLERGEMAIDAVLDLHGRTQDEAFSAFNTFVLRAYHAGLRCVLVITGKGSRGDGVLKAQLPHWADAATLRPVILRCQAARDHHGGGGAFYILLRRNRA